MNPRFGACNPRQLAKCTKYVWLHSEAEPSSNGYEINVHLARELVLKAAFGL
jgi:hypothetical protein